jgi:hypothetical protein
VTIEQRLEALTMNLELLGHDLEAMRDPTASLLKLAEEDGNNIRALARVAEIHERRITDLEGRS